MAAWHFERTELTEKIAKLFDLGLTSSIAIIAPRRKGKSSFLLNDLMPACAENYTVVYCSLWEYPNDPAKSLYLHLEKAISEDKSLLSFFQFGKNIQKLKYENEFIGKAEIELSTKPVIPSDQALERLSCAFNELKKTSKKPILFIIDEIQHLKSKPEFNDLTFTLRTLFDESKNKVKSLFTGSSRTNMHLLLNEQQAPFYQFAQVIDFPDLGDEYLAHLQKNLSDSGELVALPKLRAAYIEFDKSPFWMQKLATSMIMDNMPFDDCIEYTQRLIAIELNFSGIYQAMKPQDRIVFMAVANKEQLYSDKLRSEIERKCKVKGNNPNIQTALDRLVGDGIISKHLRAGYQIEKPGLRAYIDNLETGITS